LLTQWQPLLGRSLHAIGRKTIAERLTVIGDSKGRASANKARNILSALFGWAIKEGLVESNPVLGTNKYGDDKRRDRVPSLAELRAIWRQTGDNTYGTIVKLLMLTGQRREEIGGLKWAEIDFANQVIRLPAARVKNKQPMIFR
jgi:integrase